MRRILMLVTAVALLGSVLSGVAGAKPNASPHFVPSAFSGFQDPNTGIVTLNYVVTGLGNRGYGYIVARGVLTVSAQCEKRNGEIINVFLDHDVRVNEHDIFGNRNGNYTGSDQLRPSAVCPRGATLRAGTAVYTASDVTVTLYNAQNKAVTYDTYQYPI